MNRLSELAAVVAAVDPDAYTAAAYDTDVIDMSRFERVVFIVMAGDLGSSATLDFKVQGGATSAPSTDLTGKSITQLTQAGSDSDKQAVLEVSGEDLVSQDQGFRYIKGVMTVGTATSDCGVVALGMAKNLPSTDFDLASVDEIKV
ncbi:MAG: hypothetical protein ACRC33_22650 [Gemmataceae bacterium]